LKEEEILSVSSLFPFFSFFPADLFRTRRFLVAEVFANFPVNPVSETESSICGFTLPTFFSPESTFSFVTGIDRSSLRLSFF
jgi:hypothetical protein